MTGLQDAVQEWKNAPPASTLPHPSFALSSSVRLEEGMRQMLEVVADLSATVLSDQGSQDPKTSAWKVPKPGGTAIPKWTEYWSDCEMKFFLSD